MTRSTDGRCEIAIVGDGIAALAAARALQQRGCAPLRISPSRSGSGNRGELLGPRALAPLKTLEWGQLLDDRRLALPAEARYSAWGSSALVSAPVDPDAGAGWYVDRTALETAMRKEITESGSGTGGACPLPHSEATRIDAAVTGVDRDGDAWRLSLSTGDAISARFVVDASGRAATIVRRLGGPRRRKGGLIAMHRTLAIPESTVMSASLIESAPDGWWYSSPVPGGDDVFIAYFIDADLLPDGASRDRNVIANLLANAPLTRARLESFDAAIPATPWRIDVAATTLRAQVAGNGWAAAGDAAAALDPLSGHGLTVALWSGIQAAAAAHAWLDGDDEPLQAYRAAIATGMRRIVADAERHYRAERRFLDRPFWSRRHAASE